MSGKRLSCLQVADDRARERERQSQRDRAREKTKSEREDDRARESCFQVTDNRAPEEKCEREKCVCIKSAQARLCNATIRVQAAPCVEPCLQETMWLRKQTTYMQHPNCSTGVRKKVIVGSPSPLHRQCRYIRAEAVLHSRFRLGHIWTCMKVAPPFGLRLLCLLIASRMRLRTPPHQRDLTFPCQAFPRARRTPQFPPPTSRIPRRHCHKSEPSGSLRKGAPLQGNRTL